MAKILRCRDLGFECGKVVRGEMEGEVLTQAAEHAMRDHGVEEITDELVRRVQSAIHNDQAAGA